MRGGGPASTVSANEKHIAASYSGGIQAAPSSTRTSEEKHTAFYPGGTYRSESGDVALQQSGVLHHRLTQQRAQ